MDVVNIERVSPFITVDMMDTTGARVPGGDGIPDYSGGFIYYISDGENALPYSDRISELESIVIDAELATVSDFLSTIEFDGFYYCRNIFTSDDSHHVALSLLHHQD